MGQALTFAFLFALLVAHTVSLGLLPVSLFGIGATRSSTFALTVLRLGLVLFAVLILGELVDFLRQGDHFIP